LGLFAPRDAFALAAEWATALPPGGTLTLAETDLLVVTDALAEGRLSPRDAVAALYGAESLPRRTAYVLAEGVELLERLGFGVVGKTFEGTKFVVRGEKLAPPGANS